MSLGITLGTAADNESRRSAAHAAESMSEHRIVEGWLSAAQEVLGAFKPSALGFDPLIVRQTPLPGFDDIRRLEIVSARTGIHDARHKSAGAVIFEIGAVFMTVSIANKDGVLLSFADRTPMPADTFKNKMREAAQQQKLLI